jgi:hypothetical protein
MVASMFSHVPKEQYAPLSLDDANEVGRLLDRDSEPKTGLESNHLLRHGIQISWRRGCIVLFLLLALENMALVLVGFRAIFLARAAESGMSESCGSYKALKYGQFLYCESGIVFQDYFR